MTFAVSVKGLSKRYTLHHVAQVRHESLREVITNGARSTAERVFSGRAGREEKTFDEEFWALKDVGFEVRQGERLGIIGRNGAGKSTLLKILSRITEPTEGRIEIRGRVSSLLEVGTGFHPELTGRENVYLNGTILGMSSVDIRRKFDEIVAFAEIDRFLDTPVKRYSSGMYVRLAFAVAAHLEPEILIVDEVLAVGDAAFQRKCLGRMEDVARNEGRTILFVSHGMASVRKLCDTAIYLEGGKIKARGAANDVVDQYVADTYDSPVSEAAERLFPDLPDQPTVFRRIAFVDDQGRLKRTFGLDQQIWLELDYELRREVKECMVIFAISRDGVYIYQSHDTDLSEARLQHRAAGCYRARVALPRRLLTAGTYSVYPAIAIGANAQYGHHGYPEALRFTITEEDQAELIAWKSYSHSRGAYVVAELEWQTATIDSAAWQEAGVGHADRTGT